MTFKDCFIEDIKEKCESMTADASDIQKAKLEYIWEDSNKKSRKDQKEE